MGAGLIQSSLLSRLGIGLILISSVILMLKDYLIEDPSPSLPHQCRVYLPISPVSHQTIQCRFRLSTSLLTVTPNMVELNNVHFSMPVHSAQKSSLVNYSILKQQKIPFCLPLLL